MRQKFEKHIISLPQEHIGKLCHVDGWPVGCVFKLMKTDGVMHTLATPKTGRIYKGQSTLLKTRKQYENEKGGE